MVANDLDGRSGRTMARRVMATVLLFSMAEACGGDIERIHGEISWTTNGVAKIAECQTGRVLEFGTMASSPYFRLLRRYEELSSDGKSPVLAEIEGVVTASSRSASRLTIEQPRIIDLAAGKCDKVLPGETSDSRRAGQLRS